MDCFGCQLAEICKIKDMLAKAAQYGQLTFNSCTIKNKMAGNNRGVGVQALTTRPSLNRNFREESNRAAQRDTDFENKVSSIRVVPELSEEDQAKSYKVKCETCGATTTLDDLKTCDKCGSPVCSVCGTEQPDHTILCEKCWADAK
jgi:hypothetical protein